ncbi:MAG: bifunctional folylpolyglutamate synthase/dihydrofolate synthase, partial [Nevskiales bacterium]|nr:bifunctional folylpolyglutamate synthase/dihydrofolate synthase [Nevskiales bacterium]
MRSKPPTANATLEDWLHWQETLHPQVIALGLERVRTVALRLALPAPDLCTLTVAGTNGKGSSVALLSEIYGAAGYRVGRYTSPHLLRYNERVTVNGRAASDAELCRAFAAVEQARRNIPLTYFEFGTLAALWLFREARLQIQVLEVGLGGRLDAVNIVDADGALVTPIGLDHGEFLGDTREQIGFEKAGILRPRRPAVCADPDPPASLQVHAESVGAPLYRPNEHYRYQVSADVWHWQGLGRRYKKLPSPALAGLMQ